MAQINVPQPLCDNIRKVEPDECGVNVMPVSDILKDETDKNHAKAIAAFKGLVEKTIEYEDSHTWLCTSIIEHPEIEKGSESQHFTFTGQFGSAFWISLKDTEKIRISNCYEF